MEEEIFLKNEEETKKAGFLFAKEILKTPGEIFVLALSGELGSGKTTFLQGFAKGLGVKEKINSPTFVLMKRFKVPGKKFKNFFHLDCWRIKNAKELAGLELEKILSDSGNIIALEWPDVVKKILPASAIALSFEVSGQGRILKIQLD